MIRTVYVRSAYVILYGEIYRSRYENTNDRTDKSTENAWRGGIIIWNILHPKSLNKALQKIQIYISSLIER